MFATLLGTNKETEEHKNLCAGLCQIAVARGFVPPDTRLRVQPDQMSLAGWQIEQRGPANAKADFLLAVTAPKVPSISPIPVMKTVSGPLFSVIVMPNFVGVWREDKDDKYSEHTDASQVREAFEGFLRSLGPKTTDMAPDEFSLYVDSLFLGRVTCSICGSEFSIGARPAHDDADMGCFCRPRSHSAWLATQDRRRLEAPLSAMCQRSDIVKVKVFSVADDYESLDEFLKGATS